MTASSSATSSQSPRLISPSEPDRHGGYVQSSLSAPHGHTVAVYEWAPEDEPVGLLFFLHGLATHACFGLLGVDKQGHRTVLEGSLVRHFLKLNFHVVAHDHPGHGRSTGLHGYVDSHDELRDAAVTVIRAFRTRAAFRHLPAVAVGESMGGSVCIRVAAKAPKLIDHYVLISPAVRLPDGSFGLVMRLLRKISALLDFLVPHMPVFRLPPSKHPCLAEALRNDGLTYLGLLRVRMVVGFLRVYKEIEDNAHNIRFNSLAVFAGAHDISVAPEGIRYFCDRIECVTNKKFFFYDNIGHDVMREPGGERPQADMVQWLQQLLYTKR